MKRWGVLLAGLLAMAATGAVFGGGSAEARCRSLAEEACAGAVATAEGGLFGCSFECLPDGGGIIEAPSVPYAVGSEEAGSEAEN